MLKKVPKVAVLRPICSDLGRDSLYSNEMHRGVVAASVLAREFRIVLPVLPPKVKSRMSPKYR